MRFADPYFLLLLPLALGYAWLRWPRRARPPRAYVTFPWLAPFAGSIPDRRARWVALPVALRAVGICLIVLALARPHTGGDVRDVKLRGRNIMLTLDVSSSMRAVDFRPHNRLHVAKNLLADFVARRDGDLLGLVVFAGQVLTQAPLTTDTDVLTRMLRRAETGMLADGTAIGMAIATSLSQVSDLPPRSSAIVLITDGANNAGQVDPLTAAEAARALGVRVYTIGVSAKPSGKFVPAWSGASLRDLQPLAALDEEVLRRIADRTRGRYYRAVDSHALSRTLSDIDRLEKTQIRVKQLQAHHELYSLFLLPALVVLALELLLRATWLRTLP